MLLSIPHLSCKRCPKWKTGALCHFVYACAHMHTNTHAHTMQHRRGKPKSKILTLDRDEHSLSYYPSRKDECAIHFRGVFNFPQKVAFFLQKKIPACDVQEVTFIFFSNKYQNPGTCLEINHVAGKRFLVWFYKGVCNFWGCSVFSFCIRYCDLLA